MFVLFSFYSDHSESGTGFRVEWQIQGCGGHLTHLEGDLTSPNYPLAYPTNIDCQWTIELHYGHNIQITVHDMELENQSIECEFDGFQVAHDAEFKQIISKICHKIVEPVVITGQGHKLYVKFHSDISGGGKGFRATYKAIPTANNCGGIFTVQSGTIMSPNYPKNYGKDLYCEWKIQTHISNSLVFQLIDFDMESSDNCTKDSFAIYDTVLNKLLWEGCGSNLPNQTIFNSDRNELMVRMKSDKETEAKGFKGTFSISCGAIVVTNDMGELFYRKTIESNEICKWVIKSEDPLKHITVAFTHLQHVTTFDGDCENTISVFDGDTFEAPLKKMFCGSKIPPAFVSNGNALTVVLNNNNLYQSEFSFRYSVLDNGKFSIVC